MKATHIVKPCYINLSLIILSLILSFHARSQTTKVIDYSSANLGSGCNVFASETLVSQIAHKTSYGAIEYSQQALLLKASNPSSANIKVSAFSIHYSFISGKSYVIKINASVINNNTSGAPPLITTGFGTTLEGSGGDCNGSSATLAPTYFSYPKYQSTGAVSNSFIDYTVYSGGMPSNNQYMIIAFQPPAPNGSNNGSQYSLLIKKIEIT